jgi:hypothetical protein
MTESGSEAALRLEALLPPEMAKQAEEIGVRKVSMDALGEFALAVLAGGFVAGHDLGLSAQALGWSGFVLRNLLPSPSAT